MIKISPAENSVVTLNELLTDFADSTPGWQYLVDLSEEYKSTRGQQACVLKTWTSTDGGTVELAFAPAADDSLRLAIVESAGELTDEEKRSAVETFTHKFESYLNTRGEQATIEHLELETA